VTTCRLVLPTPRCLLPGEEVSPKAPEERAYSHVRRIRTTQQEVKVIKSYRVHRNHLLFWTVSLMFLALTFFLTTPLVYAQTTLVVDEDGQGTAANCNADAPAFTSIQAAVNTAAPGDTLFICPGIYDEQVVVTTSNLIIRGSGTTVLQPTVVAQNTVRPGTTSPVSPILLIDGAAGVTVANLTVDGSIADSGAHVFPTCGGFPFYVGIYYRISSGAIDSVHVTNIMSATDCTFGILAQTSQSGVGGVANVVITNNLIDHYGLGGINCIGQNTVCTVTRNMIRGEGPVSDLLQVGLVIRAEARGAISGNVITDHAFIGAHGVPESAAGIFLFFAQPKSNPHLVRDNIFANNQINVQRIGTAAPFD
jgi:hypothetical protein